MNSAAAAFTCPCWPRSCGSMASGRRYTDVRTRRPTLSGCRVPVCSATPAAERVAHDVRPVQVEVIDKRGDVVGHETEIERPVDVRGSAVPLQVDRDDLVVVGKSGQDRAEHFAGSEPAVQQDHRPSGPTRLVVEVDAVDVRVLPGTGGVGAPNRWRSRYSSSWRRCLAPPPYAGENGRMAAYRLETERLVLLTFSSADVDNLTNSTPIRRSCTSSPAAARHHWMRSRPRPGGTGAAAWRPRIRRSCPPQRPGWMEFGTGGSGRR
jgi:hypothetical protein